MRRPTMCCDKGLDGGGYCCNPQGSSRAAFARRFLSYSFGGIEETLYSKSSAPPLMKPFIKLPPATPEMLAALRDEAELVLGKPLEEIMSNQDPEDDSPGVPSFVHALCCYMLTHGVDYETLVSGDFCPEDFRGLLEDMPLGCADGNTGDIALTTDAFVAAGLLRLFLTELPHPLLPRETASVLRKIRKDLEAHDPPPKLDAANRVRRLLLRKLPPHSLSLLQYITGFLDQLRTANHNTCPVSPTALSRVLAPALVDMGKGKAPFLGGAGTNGQHIAEMLLLNYHLIFRDIEQRPTDYNSDSVSSISDTKGDDSGDDDEGLFTPNGGYDQEGRLAPFLRETDGDDSTTSTSDTDDFRSPPVSPLKSLAGSSSFLSLPPSEADSRSTPESPDGDTNPVKISPFGEEYLPSITGLISPAEKPWNIPLDQPLKSELNYLDVPEQLAYGECVSPGEEVSELEESDVGQDADGSETELCPHEERRNCERIEPRRHSTKSKTKRRIRKRHSQKNIGNADGTFGELSSLLADEAGEAITNYDSSSPGGETHAVSPFRDLLATSAPIQSDRSSWFLRGDVAALSDNWKRTIHHYRREDDEDDVCSSQNWYRAAERADEFFSSNTIENLIRLPRGKLLSKKVSGLKKKIKKLEEEFERRTGYRPSHQDKMKHVEIKKHMSLLSRLKRELKHMEEEVPDRKRSGGSKSYSMSPCRYQESTSGPSTSSGTLEPLTMRETLRQVEERLSFKRDDAHRPTELSLLSLEQFQDEKTDLQKALLYYESKHGRPITKEDRDRVRPLYDRYRQVKRGISRYSSRSKESLELAPILEHVVMDFTLASPQHRGSLKDDSSESDVALTEELINPDPQQEPSALSVNMGDLHALPIHELRERKKDARERKKLLRASLRDFEAKFEVENGRKMQKEDRGLLENSYAEYKHVKAKLRLLEALLSKHSNITRDDS